MNAVIKPLRRELRGSIRGWPVLLGIIFGAYLFGMVLTSILMVTVVDDHSYAPLSLLFAQMGAVIALMASLDRFNIGFDLAVKMGETRRNYLWAAFGTAVVELLGILGFLWLLRFAENGFQQLFFREASVEMDTLVWLNDWKLTLSILILALGVLSVLGALIHRFGRKAFWIMWVFWMLAFIAFPRVMEAVEEGNDSLFGHLGRWLTGLFAGGFGIDGTYLVLGGGVLGILATVLLLRRAGVNQ